ncbi:hypothetical protein [Gorillibacterium sp. CAU 1737]|uniref:hypothetical protein n=1 Tax=Gorillibacterium sp. CAU 1737 TaxID=3140362 RepID=UPI00326102D4
MNAWEQVNWAGQLADLKEQHYRALLLVSALTELLMEKGICTPEEIALRASRLEQHDLTQSGLAAHAKAASAVIDSDNSV